MPAIIVPITDKTPTTLHFVPHSGQLGGLSCGILSGSFCRSVSCVNLILSEERRHSVQRVVEDRL
jgi:hypothetical protein